MRPSSLINPPLLPPRHDPNSEEARILGRLSLRREFNHRRKFFRTEVQKVLPPLEILEEQSANRHHPRRRLEKLHLPQMLKNMVKIRKPERPKRSIPVKTMDQDQEDPEQINSDADDVDRLPSRFLRRRHKLLLGKIPILGYTVIKSEKNPIPRPSYSVYMNPDGLSPDNQYHTDRLSEAGSLNTTWIRLANNQGKIK